MHGLIFLQLQKFAQQQAGPQAWEILLKEAGLPLKSYAPVRTYPDDEVLALVEAASRVLNQPAAFILEAFGEFIAPELIRLYGRLVQPEWKTLDVIENTEKLMHTAVRVGNPGAKPPVLECIRTTEDELQIMYSSNRQLCSLAKGIIIGLGHHFGETITVTEDACMLKGDPFCAMQVTRTRLKGAITQVAEVFETVVHMGGVPSTNVGYAAAAGTRGSFPFLKPSLQRDELGTLGDFRVLNLVGQGGMGIVFRAMDNRLNRMVALKVMQPHFSSERIMQERFLREARAMAAIKSDHMVTIYEVGEANGLPFLAMEFLQGDVLDVYKGKVGSLPFAQIVRIGREAAQGLAAAHGCNLIHRDIKPGNLWLEAATGRVKILDFGLARMSADSTKISQVGAILGTPAFMAPEQARGEEVDHRADLFSLGCVLYWLCTNEYPFKGKDIFSTLTALATQDPQPPQTLSVDIPAPLSELIMQLLQKGPSSRPASSQAVAEKLAAIEAQFSLLQR